MAASSSRRVVITGMGLVSPLGGSLDDFWTGLAGRRSGVRLFDSVPTTNLPTKVAGECTDFLGKIDDFGELAKDLKKAIRKGLKVMCRESQMGVAAAQKALADSGYEVGSVEPERCGCVFGSDYMMTLPQEFSDGILRCCDEQGQFHFEQWGTEGLSQMTPLWLLKYLPNMPGSHIAIYNDMRGPSNSITQREASSNLSVGEAYHTIVRGSADRMVAGATGTRVHPMKAVHATQSEQLAPGDSDPSASSRPFDKNRTGMVVGEGAGALVLEELESACARGARIYAEVAAAASSLVAGPNLVARRDEALANAMNQCLQQTGCAPGEVGHINAHGLASVSSDVAEAQALQRALGDRATQVPVVAPKANLGNIGAGGGVVELIASVLAFSHGRLFPVLNFETPDPECPVAAVTGDDVSPGTSCLNLSVTPQGQAAVVMLRAWAE